MGVSETCFLWETTVPLPLGLSLLGDTLALDRTRQELWTEPCSDYHQHDYYQPD